MKARAIDTLKFSRNLTKAGLDKKVAEGLAEAINEVQCDSQEDLATKHDIELLRATTKQDIALVRNEITLVRSEIELVRGEIEISKKDIIIKVGGMIFLTGVGLAGFIAWFIPKVLN